MKKYKIELADYPSVTVSAESATVEDNILVLQNADKSVAFCAAVGKWSHFKEVKKGDAD